MQALFDYQRDGIEWLKERPRALLADDPGMGKTRQLLEAAHGATLVVAPAYAEAVWRSERRKWRPKLEMEFVSYSSLCERVENEAGHKRKVVARAKGAFRQRWETLIFDESHYLKGRKTKWTRAAMSLETETLYLSTGTAIQNWAYELWVCLRLLKPRDRFLNSYWRWVQHWFEIESSPHTKWKIGGLKGCRARCDDLETCEHWEAFFDANLGGLMLARDAETYWRDRPELTQQTIRCPMTRAQRKVYEELRKDYRALVEETGEELSAWSDGGLHVKLRKVCTGLEVASAGARTSGKLKVLADLIGDRKPPVVVFCWFRDTARAAAKVCRAQGLRVAVRSGDYSRVAQDEAAEELRQGDVDVLVATLATTSESISLTQSTTAIFLEHSWKPSVNRQAIRRLYRRGQRRPVSALHLVAPESVDWAMLREVMKKKDHALRFMRAGSFGRLL